MTYFLGVDAGGTKTRAVIITDTSQVVGEAFGGPANYHNTGLVETTTNVTGTITAALKKAQLQLTDISWLTIGITACDTATDTKALYQAFTQADGLSAIAKRLTIINDSKIGLYSGTMPPGIVVICGTGANVYGINDHGDEATAGNWGHFLGDRGSGFHLAQTFFEAVVAAYDGTGTETKLTEELEKRLQVKSPPDIVDWYNKTQPTVHVISDFAPLVLEAAEAGDEVAKELVEKSIGELGKALMAVVKKLKMEDEPTRIVITGGLFESKYFRTLFEGHVSALITHSRIIKPLVSSAVGAALMGKGEWEKKGS